MFGGFKVLSGGGQGAELLVTEHPPLTSCPSPVSHARGDVSVCPSCSLKAMPGLILSWPRHNLPMASVQHPCPSGPLCWWWGAGGIVSERSLHVQAPRRGRVLGEPLPVPNACLHEASTNRSPFFLLSFNTFIPALKTGRKVP